MKQYLKYAEAGLLAAALLTILFMPLLDVSVAEISLMDVLRIGSGISGSDMLGELTGLFREYTGPYFFAVIFLILLMAASIAACLLLPVRKACMVSVFGMAAADIVTLAGIFMLYSKIRQLQSGLSFFGMEDLIRLKKFPIFLWIVLSLAVLAVGILGFLREVRLPEADGEREILPESFGRRRNPWEDRKEVTVRAERPEMGIEMGTETGAGPVPEMDFHGALKGLQGIYRKKVRPMQEKVPVYFIWDGTQVFVSGTEEGEVLAEAYYISEYQEYCVTPMAKRVCFLESGQPLGAGRHYYLKRGTKIGLGSETPVFELA